MKNKKILLIFPIAFLIIYFCAGIFYDAKNVIYIKPFIVPTFMIYAIVANHKKLTLFFYLFALFFYIGELLILFDHLIDNALQIGLISLLFCYGFLILLLKFELKKSNLHSIFRGFTLIIFLLNCIVLLVVLFVLTEQIQSFLLNLIIICNASIAVILGVTAASFLSTNSTSSAFLYFFGAYALIMSDVLAALSAYYLDNIVVNSIDRILHFASFYFIYLFVIQKKSINTAFP